MPNQTNPKRSVRVGLLLAALCFLAGRSAYGQAVYGSLYGTVRDTSGAVIKGATVTVRDEQKGNVQTTQTSESGSWNVGHLIPDSYDVKIEAPSFQGSETKDVVVHADVSQLVDVQLAVAGSTQSVTVSASDTPAL